MPLIFVPLCSIIGSLQQRVLSHIWISSGSRTASSTTRWLMRPEPTVLTSLSLVAVIHDMDQRAPPMYKLHSETPIVWCVQAVFLPSPSLRGSKIRTVSTSTSRIVPRPLHPSASVLLSPPSFREVGPPCDLPIISTCQKSWPACCAMAGVSCNLSKTQRTWHGRLRPYATAAPPGCMCPPSTVFLGLGFLGRLFSRDDLD